MKSKINTLTQKVPRLKKISKPDLSKIHARHVHIFIASVALFVVAVAGGSTWFYQHRALPGIHVANVSVQAKNREQVKQIVEQRRDAMKIHFLDHGTDTTASAKELGVTVDVDKTVDQVMQAGRNGGFWRAIQLWQHEDIPLTATTNIGVFKDYVVKHFPSIVKDAKDAELVYNEDSNKFEVQPGEPGQGFDVKKFASLLPQLADNPQTIDLPVAGAPVQPLIPTSALTQLQADMNQRVTLSLHFTYQGRQIYSADPIDIAKWMDFTPDPQTGKVTVSYDKGKITQFLNQQVGPQIAAPAIDKKVVKDQNNGNEIVIQQGQVGRKLQDIDALADEIAANVAANKSMDKEVSITEAPFKTVELTGYDKWIEVDLSEQRTTLYTGATPIQSFSISSGVASHPTVTGTFAVWYKTPSQTMTGGNKASGDYYYLPNVTWVSYFYQDYSFHTAYWHNNFGHPMSHGCINMRAADAKVVYDFAPIGTKVVVHQ
ncbi:MAG TPA: L,D-transpeptidase family protein [Candidatus Saccharimonadales bacterium]|nr:L,D-transpeptidase family protein [Candidatus Saccharimonadales bacterium]